MTEENVPVRPSQLLDWSKRLKFQRRFREQASDSFLRLSFGIGVIALLLPILLVAAGGYAGNPSISAFYHANDLSRDVMVGSLCAVALFLFLFQGLSRFENWLLNLGGLSALVVAVVPMPSNPCHGTTTIHGSAAIVFFVCLGIVAIFFSKGRIKYVIYPKYKQRFTRAYTFFGLAMFAMPAAVTALAMQDGNSCSRHYVFWAEALGVWAFAGYWFVKTAEYRMLLGMRARKKV